jgi:hypothetical protein
MCMCVYVRVYLYVRVGMPRVFGRETRCLGYAAALDEQGVAYLATMWATTNSVCVVDPPNLGRPRPCPTWGTYIMSVKNS